MDRVNDTKVTVKLTFSGNIDVDTPLVFTVGPGAIADYDGAALTAQLPVVTAVEESLVAAAEENPHLNVVKLTLSGRQFAGRGSIKDTLMISSSDGGAVEILHAAIVSDTEMTVSLGFNEDIRSDVVLTFTLGEDAISRYSGPALTAEVPVTPIAFSLTASTETPLYEELLNGGELITVKSPLTEANLYWSLIRLTLTGREFNAKLNIEDTLTFSSIDGRIVGQNDITPVGDTALEIDGEVVDIDDLVHLNDIGFVGIDAVDRVSDTELVISLIFDGDLDTDSILTLTVGADAILGYDEDFTFEFPVTAVEESLTASTEFSLTEENLNGNIVRLALNGRQLWVNADLDEITDEEAITISGIEGVTIEDISFTQSNWFVGYGDAIIELGFNDNFDTDATLTITVASPLIVGYDLGSDKKFTVELPVSATRQSDATVSISPSPIALTSIGEKLTLNLDIANGENVAGYQATVSFDPSVLNYVESVNRNYLPADAFFVEPILDYDWLRDPFSDDLILIRHVTIAGNTLAEARNGDGTLANITFEVVDYKPSEVTLSNVYLVDADGKRWEVTTENCEVIEPPGLAERIFGDLNIDGDVNIQDLIIVSNRFGVKGQNPADVNGDGIVDIVDLVLVANAFGANAAAPSLNPQVLEQLTAADVKEWLTQAQKITLTDPDYKRGITVLEQLHKALIPKTTALLPNFPNPFNPETWIPYHLAKDADVTLHIYAMNGTLVRTLTLGHQSAGMYQSRSRAAYWDGKNEFGEKVATGVYFYRLTAGDFSATRKMLIRK